MNLTIILAATLSFFTSFVMLPKLIKFLGSIGMVGIDIQKPSKPKIAEMGGPAIMSGFLAGMFLFMWLNVFVFPGNVLSLA